MDHAERWEVVPLAQLLTTDPRTAVPRLGPATAIVTAIFTHRKVDPGCPLPGAGYSGSPVGETSTEGEQRFASRNTRAQHYAD